jgi:hypothetical protein
MDIFVTFATSHTVGQQSSQESFAGTIKESYLEVEGLPDLSSPSVEVLPLWKYLYHA